MRSTTTTTTITLSILSLAAACTASDNEPEAPTDVLPLTCELMRRPNCWSAALDEVAACAPGRATIGTLSADATSCTFPMTNTLVTFSTDPTDLDFDDDLSFTVSTDGELCVAFSDEHGDIDTISLRTVSGTTSWSVGDIASAGGVVRLACADGIVYETSLESALACDGFPSVLGFTTVSDPSSFELSLLDPPDTVDVLACAKE